MYIYGGITPIESRGKQKTLLETASSNSSSSSSPPSDFQVSRKRLSVTDLQSIPRQDHNPSTTTQSKSPSSSSSESFINTFDLSKHQWKSIAIIGDAPPADIHSHTMSLDRSNSQAILIGGISQSTNTSELVSVIHILSLKDHSWDVPTTRGQDSQPPLGLHSHVAQLVDDTLFVFGGIVPTWNQESQQMEEQYSNTLYALHIPSLTWSIPSQFGKKPCPRADASASVVASSFLLFGGKSQHGFHNDLFMFQTDSMTWLSLTTLGKSPSPRSGACAVGCNADWTDDAFEFLVRPVLFVFFSSIFLSTIFTPDLSPIICAFHSFC
eukprot:TRINITY_DN7702_c0_g1_i1.p1 TRINITY_DN7702_c0_g1~~TRINITY_DN7702_c0_g1_i1.p1  ORF type:complete len:361 (+),score=50.56 TRINITY_DN7702_c0_g1_i1:112-1083(+)